MVALGDIRENFDGTTLPSGWELTTAFNTFSPTVADGALTFTNPETGASETSYVNTVDTVDVANQSVVVNLTREPTAASGPASIYLVDLATVGILIAADIGGGGSGTLSWADASGYVSGSFTWNLTDTWFRIRTTTDSAALDSSPDGLTWTELSATTTAVVGLDVPRNFMLGAQFPVNVAGAAWHYGQVGRDITGLFAEVIVIEKDELTDYNAGPFDNLLFTSANEPDEPDTSPGGYRSMWFSYTPNASGAVFVDMHGSTYEPSHLEGDTVLHVYDGGPDLASLTWVATGDDTDTGTTPEISFTAEAGTTYYFRASVYSDVRAAYRLHLVGPGTGPVVPPLELPPGAVADLSLAVVPSGFTVEPGIWFLPGVAGLALNALPAPLTLGSGDPVFDGAVAELMIDANPSVFFAGTQVVGDSFYLPVDLAGLSGTGTANLGSATLQTGEPYAHGDTRTWWFRYRAAGPGTLVVTSTDSTPHWIDIYEGASLDGLELIGSAERALSPVSVTVAVSTGTYYVRVASSSAVTLAISYSAAVETAPLIATLTGSPVDQTPASLTVNVLNAAPGESVRFSFSPAPSDWIPSSVSRPITLATLPADSTGTVAGGALSLPEVQAGTHTITVRGLSSGRTAVLTATVTADPPPIEEIPTDAEAPTFTVGYWNLYDPAPGGLGTFTFPINPSQMSSPYAPRTLTSEHTTAADGQPIIWEGGVAALDWTFQGYVDNQTFHDALVAYASLNRRFYLQDHRGRRWIVGFRGIDLKPVRNVEKPWAHNYTVSAQIYGQVS